MSGAPVYWFRVEVGFVNHPKLAQLSYKARWTWLGVLEHCAQHRTGGHVTRHAGGYSDWFERKRTLAVVDTPKEDAAPARGRTSPPPPPRKLSYLLQRELDGLPARIEDLEAQLAQLQAAAAAPDFYRKPQQEVQDGLAALAAAERELDTALARWTELEDQAAAVAATRERSGD